MFTVFKVVEAKRIQFEMVIKMPLEEWEELESQLTGDEISWDFGRKIRSMISQAKVHFYPKEDKKL